MKFKFLFFGSLLGLIILASSCKSMKESKMAKKAEKQELAIQKEDQKQYEKLVQTHYERQTELTKLRMEETRKNAEYYNQSKRKSFFQRLFGFKSKHKKPKKKK